MTPRTHCQAAVRALLGIAIAGLVVVLLAAPADAGPRRADPPPGHAGRGGAPPPDRPTGEMSAPPAEPARADRGRTPKGPPPDSKASHRPAPRGRNDGRGDDRGDGRGGAKQADRRVEPEASRDRGRPGASNDRRGAEASHRAPAPEGRGDRGGSAVAPRPAGSRVDGQATSSTTVKPPARSSGAHPSRPQAVQHRAHPKAERPPAHAKARWSPARAKPKGPPAHAVAKGRKLHWELTGHPGTHAPGRHKARPDRPLGRQKPHDGDAGHDEPLVGPVIGPVVGPVDDPGDDDAVSEPPPDTRDRSAPIGQPPPEAPVVGQPDVVSIPFVRSPEPPARNVGPAVTPPTEETPSARPGPSVLDRTLGALPEPRDAIPSLRDPTVPMLLVVVLVAYALVVARGDRRDPKLVRSSVDPGSRGLGFK